MNIACAMINCRESGAYEPLSLSALQAFSGTERLSPSSGKLSFAPRDTGAPDCIIFMLPRQETKALLISPFSASTVMLPEGRLGNEAVKHKNKPPLRRQKKIRQRL